MILGKVGCDWGSKAGTDDDHAPCPALAVGVVAVKDGPRVHKLVLCSKHRLLVVSQTAPAGRGR